MRTFSADDAAENLDAVLDLCLSGETVRLSSASGTSVLMSEEAYEGLIETAIVLSDPDTLRALASDEDPRDAVRWDDVV